MGSQTNFFLTGNDLASLEQAFRRAGDFLVIKDEAEGGRMQMLQSTHRAAGDQFRIYLARPHEMTEILLREIPGRGYHLIDVERSPVIEFDRCYHQDNIFRPGRMYVINTYWEGETH